MLSFYFGQPTLWAAALLIKVYRFCLKCQEINTYRNLMATVQRVKGQAKRYAAGQPLIQRTEPEQNGQRGNEKTHYPSFPPDYVFCFFEKISSCQFYTAAV